MTPNETGFKTILNILLGSGEMPTPNEIAQAKEFFYQFCAAQEREKIDKTISASYSELKKNYEQGREDAIDECVARVKQYGRAYQYEQTTQDILEILIALKNLKNQ
jgi:hypothetical protein